jgi:hypothetical protein
MSMHGWRTLLLTVAVLIVAAIGFATWYRAHFSMDTARAFEVNDRQASPHVLIATQGSKFKDAVVAGVVDRLKSRGAYVNVIDISALRGVDDGEWDGLVLLHTWEMGKPPTEVQAFVDRARGSGKLVALTTSGAGDFRIDGIDAISSASVVTDAAARAGDILVRLEPILDRKSAN